MQRFLFLATATLGVAVLLLGSPPASSQNDKTIEKVMAALPDKAPAKPKQPRKLLIYSKTAGFRHGSRVGRVLRRKFRGSRQ